MEQSIDKKSLTMVSSIWLYISQGIKFINSILFISILSRLLNQPFLISIVLSCISTLILFTGLSELGVANSTSRKIAYLMGKNKNEIHKLHMIILKKFELRLIYSTTLLIFFEIGFFISNLLFSNDIVRVFPIWVIGILPLNIIQFSDVLLITFYRFKINFLISLSDLFGKITILTLIFYFPRLKNPIDFGIIYVIELIIVSVISIFLLAHTYRIPQDKIIKRLTDLNNTKKIKKNILSIESFSDNFQFFINDVMVLFFWQLPGIVYIFGNLTYEAGSYFGMLKITDLLFMPILIGSTGFTIAYVSAYGSNNIKYAKLVGKKMTVFIAYYSIPLIVIFLLFNDWIVKILFSDQLINYKMFTIPLALAFLIRSIGLTISAATQAIQKYRQLGLRAILLGILEIIILIILYSILGNSNYIIYDFIPYLSSLSLLLFSFLAFKLSNPILPRLSDFLRIFSKTILIGILEVFIYQIILHKFISSLNISIFLSNLLSIWIILLLYLFLTVILFGKRTVIQLLLLHVPKII